ncbi:hypothetical protein Tco_0323952 [Tanacetum coccineum]
MRKLLKRLQEELKAELEEEESLARKKEEDANIAEWDNVQAMIDADYELAARLQAQEQEELTIEERPEEAYERVLWGDCQCCYKPDIDSEVGSIYKDKKLQFVEVIFFKWSTFCKILESAYLYAGRKKYPLMPATITTMLNKKLQADHWNEMCYQLLKLMTKQVKNPKSV